MVSAQEKWVYAYTRAVADIGDVNDDGIPDLAVGAPNDDDGSDNAGALWILMMKADGKVAAWQKVSSSMGGFDGNLKADDHAGAALAGIGDLDNNGIPTWLSGHPGVMTEVQIRARSGPCSWSSAVSLHFSPDS